MTLFARRIRLPYVIICPPLSSTKALNRFFSVHIKYNRIRLYTMIGIPDRG